MTINSGRTPELQLPPDLQAAYSNLVRITHTPAELVFDFASLMPGQILTKIVARLILSPVSAKLFYRALGENLARYEAAFGPIPLPGDGALANNLFNAPHPPEPPKGEG